MADDKETRDILAYIQGRLPNVRRTAFENRLLTDATLRGKVERYQQTVAGLEHRSALARMRKLQEDTIQEPQPEVRPLWQPHRYQGTVAAAVAVLILASIGVYRVYFNPAQRAFTAFYQPDVGFRGGEETCAELESVSQLYAAEQYEQALTQLTQRTDTATACSRYERGLINLALDEPEAAIVAFQQIGPSAATVLFQKRDWYLSLAYLKNNQPDSARPLLEKISADDNHPFFKTVQRVLARLDQ